MSYTVCRTTACVLSLAKVALCLVAVLFGTIVHSDEASAASECAARTFTKPDYESFRTMLKNKIKGTQLFHDSMKVTVAAESGRMSLFDYHTREYYNRYLPRDIVCIVDSGEKEDILREYSIRNTYSGTTVLLSHVDITSTEFDISSSSEEVRFFQSLFPQIVRELYDESDCVIEWDDPYQTRDEYCLSELDADREELFASLDHLDHSRKNSSLMFVYNPNSHDVQANTHTFESFVGAVAALEAANEAFYDRPLHSESTRLSPYRIFDPIRGGRRPATSLLRFVGNKIVDFTVGQMFHQNLSLGHPVNLESTPAPTNIRKTDIVGSSESRILGGSTLDQMMAGFLCTRGGNSGVALGEIDQETVLRAANSVICNSDNIEEKRVIDLTDTAARDWDLYRAVKLIVDFDTRNVLDARLKELAEIELQQLAALESVHKYVAMESFDRRLNSMREQLQLLESQKGDAFGDVVNIGTALAGIATGGAGFMEGWKQSGGS